MKASKWLLLMLAAYSAVMSYFVLLRFYAFQTHAFDLGIFNQAFSTALQGKLFYETPDQHIILSGSFLGTHFNLLMFLLLPVYALFPHAQTLLLLQTGFIALGAVPLYLIARKVIGSEKIALAMALVFLVNPAILNLNLYDFHLEAFLPFFLGMFFYYYIVENWRGYTLFLALSLITIEFASVLVVAICLAHGLRTLSRKPGTRYFFALDIDKKHVFVLLPTILVALATLYLVIFLSGVFSGTVVSLQGVVSGSISPVTNSQTIVLKSEFWVLPLITLMFLPLLALSQLIIVAPWFAVTALSSNSTYYSLGYQYAGAFVFPFLLIGTIYSLQKLQKYHWKDFRGPIIGMIVFSLVINPFSPVAQGRISGLSYQEGFPQVTSHDQVLEAALSLIQSNASILTQNNLFPQVSNRADAYVYLTSDRIPIQYVLADAKSSWYSDEIWGNQSMKYWLPYFMSTGHYGVVVNDDGVILLEAGYAGPILLSAQTTYIFDYHSLDLYSGSEVSDPNSTSGTVLLHASSDENGVTFWFGPYAPLPPGQYMATFHLMTSTTTTGSLDLQVSDFLNSTASSILAQKELNQTSFAAPNTWSEFSLTFHYDAQQSLVGELEFKGADVNGGPFYLDYVQVTYLGPATG